MKSSQKLRLTLRSSSPGVHRGEDVTGKQAGMLKVTFSIDNRYNLPVIGTGTAIALLN